MAKKNRRINIGRLEVHELRAKLAAERKQHGWQLDSVQSMLDEWKQAPAIANPTIDSIAIRLRAICADTFCLPAAHRIDAHPAATSFIHRLPPPVKDFIEHGRSECIVDRVELIRFAIDYVRHAAPDVFKRHVILRVWGRGEPKCFGVAVSPETLRLMRDAHVATDFVAAEFGRAIACALRDGSL